MPEVSINIPTFNSAKTLGLCLDAIRRQTFQDYEIVVADGYSTDKTVDIARSYGAKVVFYPFNLLGARKLACQTSRGEFVLLLDCDQILMFNTLERAIKMMDKFDFLCLEEMVYDNRSLIGRLVEADRTLTHKFTDVHLDPIRGALLARLYKKSILDAAFKAIPEQLMPIIHYCDHAIINWEAHKISQKVGLLPRALKHIEPTTLWEMWRKQLYYGRTARKAQESGYYKHLLVYKRIGRRGILRDLRLGIPTLVLLALKAIPFYVGYWSG